MPRTLVVGATGFVGGYLVRELESAGHSVVQANFPEFNLLNLEQVEKTVRDAAPDYVVNLAAVSSVGQSWKDPLMTVDVNIKGSLHLLDSIQKFAPKAKTLLIGSAEEYAPKDSPLKETDALEASNPYGITKVAQENFANLYRKKFGMQIVCTRSFNHTGVGQLLSFALPSFCKQVADMDRSGKPGKIYVGNLSAFRDFSDVEDVVHVYRMLLETENDYTVYNVGSGKAHSMRELLQMIIDLAKVQIEVVQDPEKMRPVDIPYLCADNSRVQKFFRGTDIRETIRKMFSAFRNA
ncbi:GDP-mannose 4,6-dehydratase [Hallerella succinigenes]|uniref:GDP-4-dehydro-6-deoxy-D-mannose reductase n=1 Tax=Hallerella succinigenes TaxID=1896222 RepID=A0A2M9A9Y8_9BACT|nr:GDP-mannose 4,6-dehydratase [Hallerella succinigenes]MBS7391688.1 GDP-mannose 4,6-dehydratase [Fibrobacter sp.]MDD6091064.1 GDP-mannose 4,6-dehydratase [Hallerella succinigenes]PJJ42427.1 GDP-4-dehydro-6-deoxy-D-mannose reductase [Hallerella succinigenes]